MKPCLQKAQSGGGAPHVTAAAVHDPVVPVKGQLVAQQVEQPRLWAVVVGAPLEALEPWLAALLRVQRLPALHLRHSTRPTALTGLQKCRAGS